MRKALLTCLASACLVAGCTPSYGLEGSIDEVLSLKYNQTRIRKQEPHLLIEYLLASAQGTEKICKIVVNTADLSLPEGGDFDLSDDAFLEHVELQRTTFANDSFPAIRQGEIRFDDIEFSTGKRAAGEFNITFEDFSTLRGWFAGDIDD